MKLELKDSSFFESTTETHTSADCENSSVFMQIIDDLHEQFDNNTIDIICLQSYNSRVNIECPVSYKIKSYKTLYRSLTADHCEYFTSHYIGRYSKDGYSIIINPRFGNLFNYLMSYATNLYLPNGESDVSNNTKNNSYWLIAILWRAMLNKALTKGQIPKEYQTITKNQKHYRGHLAINKHIHANLYDATKFYCSYKKLSMDNTINRTIRTIYGLLKREGLSSIIGEFEAYDKYLLSMGVNHEINDTQEIDNINYTRLSSPYKPVMELSRIILTNYNTKSSNENVSQCGVSFFVDIAELWEMYLLKLLQNNLSSEYNVYSPNYNYGDTLLEGHMREIRPDIIIEKNKNVIMIIDAKYKKYECIGKTAKNGIQREDLYQMTTYIYHYSKKNQNIVGLFTAPIKGIDDDIHTFSENKNQRIGLVNMNIVDAENDISLLHNYEKEYIDKINKILSCL